MEIILNKENMLLQDYNINEITIETSTTNPTINIEFFEAHPFIKDKITPAHITYEKKLFTTSVSYQRDLTPKSGIEIHFNKAQNGIITEGYIDFYTIKKAHQKEMVYIA